MTAVATTPTTAAPATNRPNRARRRANALWGLVAWLVGIVFFLPVAWMVLTSLHSEADAGTNPPKFTAPLTLDGYREFFGATTGASPWPPLINSATASIASTLLVLALAIPAAYALAIKPVRKWTDVLFFFLSTKMLPAVAALLPIYLIAQKLGLLDNIWLMVILYTSMNLPIAVWMMHSFLAEVLICFIFSWNELLFARVLTATVAQTAPVFLTSFVTSQGLFLAKVCAAATAISLPVLAAGFAAQDKLVQGLSLGAVK
ncbi:MAG: carbohydrate ABC transporter permease [Actinobacteria bacterium]|nr:MAG: carbohydrate ABC transporter permease [Actinomycetota bacterium]